MRYEKKFYNVRCRICNSVSHGEIAGDFGDHSEAAFYIEDDNLGFLCHSCYVSTSSALDDFSLDEDFDSDEEPYFEDEHGE